MLEGVVPFPPEFAKRYRERGYWTDKSLAQEFKAVFERYADRIALIDRDRSITYAELDCSSTNLALHLLGAGLVPLDRVVVQLPNVAEFVVLYFALQKIGCIPIAALVTHRFLEVSQFAKLSGAAACVTPDRHGDFDFIEMVRRVRKETPAVKLGIVLGEAPAGFLSFADLVSREPGKRPEDLRALRIDPTDPAILQLSGGTTGVPKLIPRSHNDYVFNSKTAATMVDVRPDDALLVVLP